MTQTFMARLSGALVMTLTLAGVIVDGAVQAADRRRVQDAHVRLLHQVGGASARRPASRWRRSIATT